MRMISHDALVEARKVYGRIRVAHGMLLIGQERQARAVIAELASIVTGEIPVLEEVIATQAKAADETNAAQWSPWGRLPVGVQPQPHLHANDNHLTHSEHA